MLWFKNVGSAESFLSIHATHPTPPHFRQNAPRLQRIARADVARGRRRDSYVFQIDEAPFVAAVENAVVCLCLLNTILLLQMLGVPYYLIATTESESMALLCRLIVVPTICAGMILLNPAQFAHAADAAATDDTAPAEAGPAPAPDKSQYTLLNPTPDDQMRAFTPDRPTQALTPFTVDAGHFQYESDLFN